MAAEKEPARILSILVKESSASSTGMLDPREGPPMPNYPR
jgi:hypothetical protein